MAQPTSVLDLWDQPKNPKLIRNRIIILNSKYWSFEISSNTENALGVKRSGLWFLAFYFFNADFFYSGVAILVGLRFCFQKQLQSSICILYIIHK